MSSSSSSRLLLCLVTNRLLLQTLSLVVAPAQAMLPRPAAPLPSLLDLLRLLAHSRVAVPSVPGPVMMSSPVLPLLLLQTVEERSHGIGMCTSSEGAPPRWMPQLS